MAKNDAVEEVIPSAKRLINTLRSLGYEFSTAVAELVDNSIEANATEVIINVEYDGENSWVMIADNGRGMSGEKLKEAMRYGSDSTYDEKSLGKFGLGLKTASFSQSKRWIVATRNESPKNEIIAFKWDLAHVNKTDRWEIIPINEKNLEDKFIESLENKTGTVVLWKELEIVLGYGNPYTEHARKKVVNLCRDLEEHLAMVFHRFLMGEVPGRKLRIFLNNNEIQPWDPFARTEKATKTCETIRIPVEHDGAHGEIVIEPYILPPSKLFSTQQAHSRAAGPKKWNQQQGFYIYRNDRMIQSGGWCRIRTLDEHTKLARFAINFASKIDSAFKIDVSKMYVQLPPQIRKEVEEKTQPLVMQAREIYDNALKDSPIIPSLETYSEASVDKQNLANKQKIVYQVPVYPTSKKQPDSVHSEDITPIYNRHPSVVSSETKSSHIIIEEESTSSSEKTWTIDEIFNALKKDAKPSEIRILERLFDRLREQIRNEEVKQ